MLHGTFSGILLLFYFAKSFEKTINKYQYLHYDSRARSVTSKCLFAGSCLECHSFSSLRSWKDYNETRSECPPTDDQCIKLHVKARVGQVFLKGCAEQCLCDSTTVNPICREGAGSDVSCDIWCCNDKDNGNVGSVLHISSFILLSYALASLLVFVLV